MSAAYASVHMQVVLDPERSVNLLIPIDVLYLFNNTTWLWHHGENDAFPEYFSFSRHKPHEHSFRMKARLFEGKEEIEKNKILDFRKCKRISEVFPEDYLNSLGYLKI